MLAYFIDDWLGPEITRKQYKTDLALLEAYFEKTVPEGFRHPPNPFLLAWMIIQCRQVGSIGELMAETGLCPHSALHYLYSYVCAFNEVSEATYEQKKVWVDLMVRIHWNKDARSDFVKQIRFGALTVEYLSGACIVLTTMLDLEARRNAGNLTIQ